MLIRPEPVHDPPFSEVVWRHLDLYPVAREDADAVLAHAAGEVAEEQVVFCLRAENFHAERGIGEGFLDNANELNDGFTQRVKMETERGTAKNATSPRILLM